MDGISTLARFGCYSFHATKVFSSGGGALIYGAEDAARAEVYRDNGTNRGVFPGRVPAYAWQG